MYVCGKDSEIATSEVREDRLRRAVGESHSRSLYTCLLASPSTARILNEEDGKAENAGTRKSRKGTAQFTLSITQPGPLTLLIIQMSQV